MVNLEAIKFWIYTAKAPCLYNCNRISQRNVASPSQNCDSRRTFTSFKEDVIVSSPRRKRKKKLLAKLTSSSSSNQNFVYFEKSLRTNKRATFVSEESEFTKSYLNVGSDKEGVIQISDSDENIFLCTNVSNKSRNIQHNILTSTPINQNNVSNHNKLRTLNIDDKPRNLSNHKKETSQNTSKKQFINKNFQDTTGRLHSNSIRKLINIEHCRNKIQSNSFDDISDVSGFTANYIRTTKLLSAKNRKRILGTKKISTKVNRSKHRNNIKGEPLNQILNKHVHSKSCSKKINDSFPRNRTTYTKTVLKNNNTNSFDSLGVCDNNVEKIKERNVLYRCETNNNSSSEEESIFAQRSKFNYRNKILQRKTSRLQSTLENLTFHSMKSKVEKQAGVMFYKSKKSVLGQSNFAGVDNSCETLDNIKATEKKTKKNKSGYRERVKKHIVMKTEDGTRDVGHSMESQNKTKSRNNTSIYFSDCDSDIQSGNHKYFH